MKNKKIHDWKLVYLNAIMLLVFFIAVGLLIFLLAEHYNDTLEMTILGTVISPIILGCIWYWKEETKHIFNIKTKEEKNK